MKRTYLGDGLYAHDDGFQFTLSTQREQEHYVCLDPDVMHAFLMFVGESRGLKITVSKAGVQEKEFVSQE